MCSRSMPPLYLYCTKPDERDQHRHRMIRKGSVDAIRRHVEANGGHFPADVDQKVDQVARQGATPLVVVEGSRVLGVIALKDIVKGGIKERFAQLRKWALKR